MILLDTVCVKIHNLVGWACAGLARKPVFLLNLINSSGNFRRTALLRLALAFGGNSGGVR